MRLRHVFLSLLFIASISQSLFSKTFPEVFTELEKSLTENQRQQLVLSFDDMTREFWSFLPGAMMPRMGIRLDALNEEQRELVRQLLSLSLSEKGYNEVIQIISLESVLAELQNNTDFRDPLKYSVVFYGHPVKDKIWSWSFQGHHIALNFTMVEGQLSLSPRFLGASPQHVHSTSDTGLRTLAGETDRAFELLESLDKVQQSKAVFRETPYFDIVTGTSIEVTPLKPVGISASNMTDEQRAILEELIFEYLDVLPMQLAVQRMEAIKEEGIENLYFGWAGSLQKDQPYYYRIQGSGFLIEFDCAAGNVNHVHTVWRDFNNDYGHDLLRRHYGSGHH